MLGRSLWIRIARAPLLPFAWLFERLGNRFYLGLAVALAVVFAYALAANLMGGMKREAYDLIIKSRYNAPPADPDIVLIDVDEASLAAMAPEYGRWPWPRSLMAELVEGLARQQPRAIVFDITFADADVYHPEADRYFREVIERTGNTFFPMIRLNPANDAISELRASQLPGVRAVAPAARSEATVAMVVPYLFDVLDDGRLGTNNVYSDVDGITRRQHVYRDVDGWRIGSLAANVAAALGGTLPAHPDILLNWRGRPLVYHTASFHAVYTSFLQQDSERPRDEFTGKIVIVGSTAPSLFDLTPTPVAQNHPGLEIVATAVDNLENGDYLRETPRWMTVVITFVTLGLLTLVFVYNLDYRVIRAVFTVVQTAFLAITYLFLNYSTLFVDLTAPFTAGLVYFSVARAYSMALTYRRNGHPLLSTILDDHSEFRALLLHCRFGPGDRRGSRALRAILERRAGLTRFGVAAPRIFKPAPLLRDIYSDTLLFYWLVTPDRSCEALNDLLSMLESSLEAIGERRGPRPTLGLHLHSVRLNVDREGAWRALGKKTLLETFAAPPEVPEPGVHVSASPLFMELVRECPLVSLPAILRDAGLRCETADAGVA
jgi:CHASE2 domain-containing sensor protein